MTTKDKSINKQGLKYALKRVFGFNSFLPNQREIIQSVMSRRDVFAVMPTGAGKSLCYQLPAYLLPGTCIVISPLISLMKDQVDAAVNNGIYARYLNSSLTEAEMGSVNRSLICRKIDLLYVAPERFAVPGFLKILKMLPLSLFAVDEAHCISEWGHDFRPDYLLLENLVKEFSGVPIAAFTATATGITQRDIIDRLGLRTPLTIRASFDRPNLFYQIKPKYRVEQQILELVSGMPGESGIIYRTTRNSVEYTAMYLNRYGIKALPYHAGLDSEVRKRHQESFSRDAVNIIVATIAFGMGIDKSNIRFVIHADLPKNIENYYQETGRAGRDGEPADCIMFYSRGDIPKIKYFINQKESDKERQIAMDKLNCILKFAVLNVCRRRQILSYFGENYNRDNCKSCDVCTGKVEKTDATDDARIVLSVVKQTGQRFGSSYIVDIIMGATTKRIRNLGHDSFKVYGAGKDRDKWYWRRVIDNLIAQEYLTVTEGDYPVIKLTRKAFNTDLNKERFYILKQKEAIGTKSVPVDYNRELFERLRTVRKNLAERTGVPPFVVFSDRTLHEMCSKFPVTEYKMLSITGVGEIKMKRYGKAFIGVITEFINNNSGVNNNMNNTQYQRTYMKTKKIGKI